MSAMRFMATAELAEVSLGAGVGDTLLKAVKAALWSLGEPYNEREAVGVDRARGRPSGP